MHWSRRALLGTAAGLGATLAGCSGSSPGNPPSGAPPERPSDATHSYTYLTAGGNRILENSGSVVDVSPVEIPVEGTPAWLLAFDVGRGSYWTVVRRDGTAVTHRVAGGTVERMADHGAVGSAPVG